MSRGLRIHYVSWAHLQNKPGYSEIARYVNWSAVSSWHLMDDASPSPHYFFADCLDDLFPASFFARASSLDWIECAFTIARISPGKRSSISAQREVLYISTPRRSPRITPASLSALKC